jgi:hypothetical protein
MTRSENGTDRLMLRWNAATQQWLAARTVLRAMQAAGMTLAEVELGRDNVSLLAAEMDRAEAAYFAALHHGRMAANG